MSYVFTSLAWSLCGFLAGWLLGGLGRDLIGAPLHLWTERVIGIVVVILAVVTMVTSVSVNARLENVISCQAAFNANYRQALADRNEATNQERDAQRKLILSITQGGNDQQALTEYLDALNATNANRAENPLPLRTNCS